jgi:adenine deaminase
VYLITAPCGTANIGVVGMDVEDMAMAVNRIKELDGGIVVCSGGEVIAEIAVSIVGLFCSNTMEIIVTKLNRIQVLFLERFEKTVESLIVYVENVGKIGLLFSG